ncbi:MAG: proline-rich domain-containing protein [Thermomicrobiales bacterium]
MVDPVRSKALKADVAAKIPENVRATIFPGYHSFVKDDVRQSNISDYIIVERDNVCMTTLEVIYKADFSVIVSDRSTLQELIDIVGAVAVDGDYIINHIPVQAIKDGLHKVAEIVQLDHKSDTLNLLFEVIPCRPSMFTVKLRTKYVMNVTDWEDKDDSEGASLQQILLALDELANNSVAYEKARYQGNARGDILESVVRSKKCINEPFLVSAMLTANAASDRDFFDKTASGVRILLISFTITGVDCPEETYPHGSEPPPHDHVTPPHGNDPDGPHDPPHQPGGDPHGKPLSPEDLASANPPERVEGIGAGQESGGEKPRRKPA